LTHKSEARKARGIEDDEETAEKRDLIDKMIFTMRLSSSTSYNTQKNQLTEKISAIDTEIAKIDT